MVLKNLLHDNDKRENKVRHLSSATKKKIKNIGYSNNESVDFDVKIWLPTCKSV